MKETPKKYEVLVQLGPHTGAPYPNWMDTVIDSAALADQELFDNAMLEIDQIMDDVDSGDDSGGSLREQVRNAVLELYNAACDTAVCGRKGLVLAYSVGEPEDGTGDAQREKWMEREDRDMEVWVSVREESE